METEILKTITDKYLEQKESIIECLICPITAEIFYKPVIAADGHTYEESAFNQWWGGNGTSPLTNVRIDGSTTMNYSVLSMIDKMIDTTPSLQKMRYEPNNKYNDNKQKISDLICGRKWHQLLEYVNYDLKHMCLKECCNDETVLEKILIYCHDLKVIDHVLSKCIDLHFVTDIGKPYTGTVANILSLSVYFNNYNAYTFAINNNVVTTIIDCGEDLMHIACKNGNFKLIKDLIDRCIFTDYKKYTTNKYKHTYMNLLGKNEQIYPNEFKKLTDMFYKLIENDAINKYKQKLKTDNSNKKDKTNHDFDKLEKQIFRIPKKNHKHIVVKT
jgi:hypothetical protein